MKLVIRLLCLTMLQLLLLAACSPASTPLPPPVSNTEVPTATSQPAGMLQPEPAATSRGNELDASAPTSVKYGAGRPVLIEFFRFT